MKSFYLSILSSCIVLTNAAVAEDQRAALKSPEPSKPITSPLAGLSDSSSNEPTYIRSETLTLRQKDRTFVYQGNVVVTQGDMTITADSIEGNYDQNNVIQKIVASPNVTITKGADIKGRSNRAVYEAALETVTLTESPELEQGESILTADVIRIFLKENRSAAEGQVRMKLVKRGEPAEKQKLL